MHRAVVSHHALQRILQALMMLCYHLTLPHLHLVALVALRRARKSKRLEKHKIGWCLRSGAWVDLAWTAEVPRLLMTSAEEGL